LTSNDLVRFLVENGRLWIAGRRDSFQATSDPLSPEDRLVLRTHFGHNVLNRARVAWVDEIANPDFYSAPELAEVGIPLDFRQMSGITFLDTIVLSRSRGGGPARRRPLLFHELVHFVQYRILGLDRFVSEYVEGWARNGRSYEAIPLERMAYEMQDRFERAAGRFSVEQEVVGALGGAA